MKNTLITMLRNDLESISNNPLLEPEKEFVPFKHCLKTKKKNRFSVLSNDTWSPVPSFEKIITKAQAHHEPSFSI